MTLKAILGYRRKVSVPWKGKEVMKNLVVIRKGCTYLVNEVNWTTHVVYLGKGKNPVYLNELEMKKYFNYERPYTEAAFREDQKKLIQS